jgi:hypothetical protein
MFAPLSGADVMYGTQVPNPELVASSQLRRRRPKGGQRSLREISAELATRGFMNERGNPYSAASFPLLCESHMISVWS